SSQGGKWNCACERLPSTPGEFLAPQRAGSTDSESGGNGRYFGGAPQAGQKESATSIRLPQKLHRTSPRNSSAGLWSSRSRRLLRGSEETGSVLRGWEIGPQSFVGRIPSTGVTDPSRAFSRPVLDFPRAILFDMDDTIFDHSLTCRRSLARVQAAEPRLRTRPLDAVWHEYARLLDAVQPEVFAGRITIQEARVERFRQLARFCGSEVSPESAADLSGQYRAHYV